MSGPLLSVALVQFDVTTLQAVGVWLSMTDSYYPPGTGASLITAGKDSIGFKFEDLSWAEWADYLAARRPVGIWWETTSYGPDDNIRSIYQRFVKD